MWQLHFDQMTMENSAEIHAERRRIAGELHDRLGHRLVVIAMHARRLARSGDRRWSAAALLDELAQHAMRDMREMVGVLRGTPSGRAASPSVAEGVARLAADVWHGGLSVSIEDVAAERHLPVRLRDTALRIVHEGLTNAVRHGQGPVHLGIQFGEGIAITLTNRIGGAGPVDGAMCSGSGLAGLREHVAELGGSVTVSTVGDGQFQVRVLLPLSPDGSALVRDQEVSGRA